MLSEIKKYPLSFLSLALILIISAVLFIYFGFDGQSQRRVVYAAGAFYFLWSLIHHYQKGDLQPSLILEYLLIALFAAILLTSTLL